MASIVCKNGPEHTHNSVDEARTCWGRHRSPVVDAPAVPSIPGFVGTVGASAGAGVGPTTPDAGAAATPPAPFAAQPRTIVPLPMLAATPDGYFAVRLDDNDPYRFIRIKRPQPRKGVRTNHLGCIKVQSQHSDTLRELMIYRPLGALEDKPQEMLWVSNTALEKYVILVLVDPMGAGLAYARELEHCCICGKTLTDENSRHYGIGPECVKGHPDIVAYVDGLDAEEAEDL
jgi:uncharacterized protein DUF6011